MKNKSKKLTTFSSPFIEKFEIANRYFETNQLVMPKFTDRVYKFGMVRRMSVFQITIRQMECLNELYDLLIVNPDLRPSMCRWSMTHGWRIYRQ